MNTISFVLFVANESVNYFIQSFYCLKMSMEDDDEILIIIDNEHYNKEIDKYLNDENFCKFNKIKKLYHNLNNNFAEHRNFAIKNCIKNFIFMLDCDEWVSFLELKQLHHFNGRVLAFPRINKVINISKDFIEKSGWQCDNLGILNFPDFQNRFFKNDGIHYIINKQVHEILNEATSTFGNIIIMHIKDFQRQQDQINFYKILGSKK